MTVAPPPVPPGEPTGQALRGTTAVITGSGRPGQVGEVVAGFFAARGVNLVLVERDADRAEQVAVLARSRGARVHAFGCDLTDPGAVAALASDVERLVPGGISALVHLAGGYEDGAPVADLDPALWRRLMDINLTTAFVTARAFLPALRKARGSLVCFASAAALPGARVAGAAAYAAAKGGVVTLVRAIAAEEREHGVRANALAPQAIRTGSNLESMGPDHAWVERETVALWAWWLCSAESGPVSGQVIRLG